MRTVRTSRQVLMVAAVLFAAASAQASTSREPFEIVKTSNKSALSADQGRILHMEQAADGQAVALLRTSEATNESFRDLYVVRTPLWTVPPAFLNVSVQPGDKKVSRVELLGFEPAKFAVIRADEQGAFDVSGALHDVGLGCGALMRLEGDPITFANDPTPEPLLSIATPNARVAEAAQTMNGDRIRATIEQLSAMPTRHHKSETGKGVAGRLAELYRAIAQAQNRTDVEIKLYSHGEKTPQSSLVVRIPGRARSDEILILGSHIDSINKAGMDQPAPGSDDNASGTATNLEIFRALMVSGVRLDRTIEIHGYAAEEIGLVGSLDMAAAYREERRRVIAMVQHDMNLYKTPGTPDKIWFVGNDTDSDFTAKLGQLAAHYAGVPTETGFLLFGSSDHAAWRRKGFATAFPSENPINYNRKIHTKDDTLASAASFGQAVAFAKLGLSYLVHFGGLAL